MATVRPSWISERNDFSHSESLCCSDASHQVSAQSDLRFGRRCHLKISKMDDMAAILDIGVERFKQFWISMSLWCLQSSFGSIRHTVWEEMSFEEFQDGCRGCHLGYRNRMILAILTLNVATMPPTKFQLNRTNESVGDVKNVKSQRQMDEGRTTDNRPRHKLAWSKAPGELTNIFSKIHDDYHKNVTSSVLTRFFFDLAQWPSFLIPRQPVSNLPRNHQDKHSEHDSWW